MSAPLSGDVVLPRDPVDGELVLIDRFPNGVVTWSDPSAGGVRAQLSVNTGYAANPYDYVRISRNKAYVSRYITNRDSGRERFDEGGDVLIVDPLVPAIVGRIAVQGTDGYLPFPNRMTKHNDEVILILGNLEASYRNGGPGLLVGIDTATDQVRWSSVLPGVSNCGGLTINSSGTRLAVACSGVFALSKTAQIASSDVVVLDLTGSPPVEVARLRIAERLQASVAPSIAFAADDTVVGIAFGDLAAGSGDVVFAAGVSTGEFEVVMSGAAFAIGDIRCLSGCSSECYAVTADVSGLGVGLVPFGAGDRRGGGVRQPIATDSISGLPARHIGVFRVDP